MKLADTLDFVKYQALNMLLHVLASAPGSPVEAQVYYDSVSKRVYVYNGTTWVWKATDSDLLQGQNSAYHLARANHTGTQTASTISDFAATAQSYRLDQFAAPTASVSLNSQKITNLLDPTGPQDAATMAYVDAIAAGLDVKKSVRVATTTTLPANTRSGNVLTASANGTLAAIDGVTLIVGDRLLVKNEATGANNGIYTVTSVGSGGTPWTMTRATDADTSAEVTPELYTFVEEGTTNTGGGWRLITAAPITLNTTALVFTQFNAGSAYSAGTGLTLTGSVFAIDTASGYGVRKYATDVGDGSSTAIVVTHNLGARDVIPKLRSNSTPWEYPEPTFEATSTNTVTVRFGTAPTTNQYRVIIEG